MLTTVVYGQTSRLENTTISHVGKMQDKDYIIIDAIYTAKIKGNSFTFDKKSVSSFDYKSTEITGGGGTFSKNEINYNLELTINTLDESTLKKVTYKTTLTFNGRK